MSRLTEKQERYLRRLKSNLPLEQFQIVEREVLQYHGARDSHKRSGDVAADVLQCISNFCMQHPELVQGFEAFIPSNYRVILDQDHWGKAHLAAIRVPVIQPSPSVSMIYRATFGYMFKDRGPREGSSAYRGIQYLVLCAFRLNHYIALTHLKGGDAQTALDWMEKLFWYPDTAFAVYRQEITDRQLCRSKLPRWISKLALLSGRLPESLILHDVKLIGRNALHHGSQADILSGELKGQRVALKRVRYYAQDEPSKLVDDKKQFYREAILWKHLQHKNVLPFYGVENSDPALPRMVLPLRENGSLAAYLRASNPQPDCWRLDTWIHQIAEGLKYIHSQYVVHGDLRGDNILLDDSLTAQISDFGFSLFIEANSKSHGSQRGGDYRWLAPEFYDTTGQLSIRPTNASDVYTFGHLCLHIYAGGTDPFPEEKGAGERIHRRVALGEITPSRPPKMASSLWTWIGYFQRRTPSERPSMDIFLKASHEWLSDPPATLH